MQLASMATCSETSTAVSRCLPRQAERVYLVPPPCSLGITIGSERGSYAPQRHVLARIGRPHHVINLMFQYYPDMPGWPTQGVNYRGFFRNRQLNPGDGYFPLGLDPEGPCGHEFLRQIADVRAHGSEPQLTLTLHADTPDTTLIRIAESLRPFTPMRVRINHECNGTWFHFNERWTYRQLSDFFLRFHRILHDHAPGVRTVACWNGNAENLRLPADQQPPRGRLTEDELAPAFREADIVSIDQYASLHYGWPDPSFDARMPSQFFRVDPEDWWLELENVHSAICRIRDAETDIEVHEVNEDADLSGDDGQAEWVRRFYREAAMRGLPWLRNITFYQFRDRGGLGLERESVADPSLCRDLPSLQAYRDATAHSHFALTIRPGHRVQADASALELAWSAPTEAIGLRLGFGGAWKGPHDLVLPKHQQLLVQAAGQWLLKPTGEDRLLLPAAISGQEAQVDLFILPPDGRNNRGHVYAARLQALPVLVPA